MTDTPRFPAALLPVLLASACLASACSVDAAGPTAPEPNAPGASLAVSGSVGFGFRLVAQNAASAILDGTRSVRCSDSDHGFAVYELTLTQNMVDQVRAVLGQGGTVVIEATTQHTFTGEGDYSYWEMLSVRGAGIPGMHFHAARASAPGRPSQVTGKVFEQAISLDGAAGMTAGGVITVAARAQAHGELGEACGQIAGGQAAWRAWGAVLRLTG